MFKFYKPPVPQNKKPRAILSLYMCLYLLVIIIIKERRHIVCLYNKTSELEHRRIDAGQMANSNMFLGKRKKTFIAYTIVYSLRVPGLPPARSHSICVPLAGIWGFWDILWISGRVLGSLMSWWLYIRAPQTPPPIADCQCSATHGQWGPCYIWDYWTIGIVKEWVDVELQMVSQWLAYENQPNRPFADAPRRTAMNGGSGSGSGSHCYL